jgi:hypothetical protein
MWGSVPLKSYPAAILLETVQFTCINMAFRTEVSRFHTERGTFVVQWPKTRVIDALRH